MSDLDTEIDEILVLFNNRLAIAQGEYNANARLSLVQQHLEEAQGGARDSIKELVQEQILSELLWIGANFIHSNHGDISGYLKRRIAELSSQKKEKEL